MFRGGIRAARRRAEPTKSPPVRIVPASPKINQFPRFLLPSLVQLPHHPQFPGSRQPLASYSARAVERAIAGIASPTAARAVIHTQTYITD
jgi:hypothetical protein